MAGVLTAAACGYFAFVAFALVANVGGCRDWQTNGGRWTSRRERRADRASATTTEG